MPEMSDASLRRIAENKNLNGAVSGLFSDRPEEARELLRTIAAKWDDSEDEIADTIRLYNGMVSALSEADFRWCSASVIDFKQLRRRRLEQYERFRALFELEIATVLKAQRCSMAQGMDWSGMCRYCGGFLLMARASAVLTLAGYMFRFRIPGSTDLCDWAAWRMYQNAYRPA